MREVIPLPVRTGNNYAILCGGDPAFALGMSDGTWICSEGCGRVFHHGPVRTENLPRARSERIDDRYIDGTWIRDDEAARDRALAANDRDFDPFFDAA